MKTSLIFVTLLMGILVAQAANVPIPKAKPSSTAQVKPSEASDVDDAESGDESGVDEEAGSESDDEFANQEADLIDSDEEDDDEELDQNPLPSLTCLIFDGSSAVCDAMCSMTGAIYGTPVTTGVCENNAYCQCSAHPDATLEELWNAKFNAKSVLKEITEDKKLTKKVMKILQKPLRTREQSQQDLQSVLSPEQFKKLRVNDTIAQKLFTSDNEPNKKNIKKYVAAKLPQDLEVCQNSSYRVILSNFFKDARKENTDYIIREIRRSANKTLNDFLTAFLRRYNVAEPTFEADNKETLSDVLDTTIVNQIITGGAPRKNSRSLVKKSAARVKPTPS